MADLTPPVSPRDHYAGNINAPLTLVEFGDYGCSFSAAAHPVVQRLQIEFGEKLRFVFRNFPVTRIHAHSLLAAQSAEAAALQGRFWDMHDRLFEHQRELEPKQISALAQEMDLDLDKYAAAMLQDNVAARVKDDLLSGNHSGVVRTPTFFINGARYDGSLDYDSMFEALENLLVK